MRRVLLNFWLSDALWNRERCFETFNCSPQAQSGLSKMEDVKNEDIFLMRRGKHSLYCRPRDSSPNFRKLSKDPAPIF